MSDLDHRFCVAPMMDWTDRHCRYFHRQLSRRALLHTEMVTAEAVIRGNRERLLGFDPAEHPVVLQLAGAEADRLALAAEIGAGWGYDAINLNVGCPSDRVKSGHFGACLMAEPERVAAGVAAMKRASGLAVTVKCRIGIDGRESREEFHHFVETVAEAGCRTFIVHARIAVLSGLSPKQNREAPPLKYDFPHGLKRARPELEIVVNGAISAWDDVAHHLARADGVMMGREAYGNPYVLAAVDGRIWNDSTPPPSRAEVVARMLPYIAARLAAGTPLHAMTRHLLGLYNGRPRARAWRRYLSENARGGGVEVVRHALALVEPAGEEDIRRSA